jgi:uncharacterized damage-inducible protein DinB
MIMINSIAVFEQYWDSESKGTSKLIRAMNDASLAQAVGPQDRTLGRMVWHIVTSIPEMMGRTGLKFSMSHETPMPATAQAMAEAYDECARSLVREVKSNWTDETLKVVDDMYGQQWPRGLTLGILMSHQTHHRGQMTVLMRQAGLKVPGVYGPAREEWAQMGAEPPAI